MSGDIQYDAGVLVTVITVIYFVDQFHDSWRITWSSVNEVKLTVSTASSLTVRTAGNETLQLERLVHFSHCLFIQIEF